MPMRRDILKASLAGAGMLALPGWARSAVGQSREGVAGSAPMRILVMGGTGFLGPHFVAAARANGHQLTLFNRGKTNPDRFRGEQFSDIEQLQGDRKSDLGALEGGQRWDAVLDTSAYIPADVARSAHLLAPRVGQYVLVSTISVYASIDTPGQDERAPLAQLDDPTVTEVSGETYGGLKVLCERAAEAEMPGSASIVRPGLIVGPGDNTDRFTYWPARADRGGEILAPGSPSDPTQFIDVRDLAAFLLTVIEQRHIGIYNADAPAGTIDMGMLLTTCQAVVKKMDPARDSTLTWVPADFLEAQSVTPWQDMPVWIPAVGENAGFGRVSTERAQKAGLRYRPLDTTVADTLAWWRRQPDSRRANMKAGIKPARETEVLQAWHARKDKPSG